MKDNRYVQEGSERILSIYFNTLGFGYVLMNNAVDVLDKGNITITPVDNAENLKEVKQLISILNPERVVLEDHECPSSKKGKRICSLLKKVIAHCEKKELPVSYYSRNNIRTVFSTWKATSRYEIAEVIARNVPSLEGYFFDAPKYPKVEHYRSSIFDSAALGVTHFFIN